MFLAEIPENEYIKYFAPECSLRIPNGHIVCSFKEIDKFILFNKQILYFNFYI